MNLENIYIEKVVSNGYGISKLENGAVCFTPYTADNDIVDLKNLKKKNSYYYAEVDKIRQKSEHRVNSLCKYYTICGGCNFQHISYDHQLKIKGDILKENLKKFANIKLEDFEVEPSPPFFYRNRLRGVIKDKKFFLYKRGSKELIEIDNCVVCNKKIGGFLRNSINTIEDNCEIQIFLKDNSCSFFKVDNYGAENMLNFEQVNTFINKKITDFIGDFIKLNFDYRINLLDLFCGSGNFSLALKQLANRISGYDISKVAIEVANKNLENQSYTFKVGDVYKGLKNSEYKDKYDIVILDPPKKGLKESVHFIKDISTKYIIYISCSTADLSRDLNILVNKNGFSIAGIKIFDMFPQTDHIETLVILQKIKK